MRAADRASQQGFTLVEMLVALLLISLVGLALAQFQTFQLSGTARLSTEAAARLEADNLAIDAIVAPKAPTSKVTGSSQNLGRTWYYSITPSSPPDPATFPGLVRLTITLSPTEDGSPLAVRQIVRPQ